MNKRLANTISAFCIKASLLIRDIIHINRKCKIICVLLFLPIIISAQENCFETFRNEGYENFKLTNYKSALNNFEVANDCENKPQENDILALIYKTQNCINYKKMADSLYFAKEYQVAKYFYKHLQILNNNDTSAIERISQCNTKLSCFNKHQNLALESYNKAKYNEAIILFKQANSCELKPDTSNTNKYIRLSEKNMQLTEEADNYFNSKINYKKAKDLYTIVKTNNPLDTYCNKQITACSQKMFRYSLTYKYHNYAPFGFRFDMYLANRFGEYFSFNINEDNINNSLSMLFAFGLSLKIMEKRKFKMHTYVGLGSSIISEYDNSIEESKYYSGGFYEGGLMFEFNKLKLMGGYSYSDYGNFHSPTIGFGYPLERVLIKKMKKRKNKD